jgi:hypothetical protein
MPIIINRNTNYTVSRGSFVTNSAKLLLDLYGSAAVAYSLRSLSRAYTGSAIRVRRSSDNIEQDIGFLNNNLDTTTLLNFIGSSTGFVTTWYDQSGNGRNATQATAANQPRIVNSGSIETQLSKPAIQLINQNGNGFTTTLSLTNPFSIITVVSQDLTPTLANHRIFQSSANNSIIVIKRVDNLSVYTGATVLTNFPLQVSTQPYLISFLRQSTSNFVYQNNSPVTISSTNSSDWGTFTIGAVGVFGTESTLAKLSELIIYSSNQNSNITGIHSNINSYYSIY